jgi:acetylornithine/succinyldiaminopimelate/putrescine aminotransferase
VVNLFPKPDLSAAGPYALCQKCHDLNQIMANTSFSEHARHINDGFSCSACHTAHGMGSRTATMSGERLVNFDATNSCNLLCHGHKHPQVTAAPPATTKSRPAIPHK